MKNHSTRVIPPSILYFGTPAILVSTQSPDGTAPLSPMSSAWALGDWVVLGMGLSGQGCRNLMRTGHAVIHVPGPDLHQAVDAIAPTTGCREVPACKRAMEYHSAADRFALAGLLELPSNTVAPPLVAPCLLQLEARLLASHRGIADQGKPADFVSLEIQVLRVHAHEDVLLEESDHIDTARWSTLLYVFRHYFGTGSRLGCHFRSET